MIRLIIFAILSYILYRVVKSLMLPAARKPGEPSIRPNGTITDEMVMDPQCNVYIPKQEAITANVAGETIYFCSKECKNNYLEKQRHKN